MFRLLIQVAFSLFIVLFMMWGLARALRRPFGGRGHGPLTVLTRQQLGRSSAVAVVRVADRALVLGVTEQQISYLGEAELDVFEHEKVEHRDHLVLEPTELIDPGGTALPGRHPAAPVEHGSILSPKTWSSTVEFLRERTTRK
ncbi:flagellar protein [Actinoplanes sp. SE50]|uniref:FliO/MopB family protein n=1 Tax=unclassified Actinoplanes TaxID=2626549 RepID=UPI00023EDEF6|nr:MULTISPECIES: flagellar biosynthetic protein FliO [unclassified Actinoplanes]AEV88797.1 flagellar protein FliO/FliZ [Actinoplanes sp. SE50/110]ATO87203.1 flagellar protein [Actinoplanes sp. SE50]SLM04621.1 flagellar biosynthesis protein FliO [Actinoplanes sp. SE50/110]